VWDFRHFRQVQQCQLSSQSQCLFHSDHHHLICTRINHSTLRLSHFAHHRIRHKCHHSHHHRSSTITTHSKQCAPLQCSPIHPNVSQPSPKCHLHSTIITPHSSLQNHISASTPLHFSLDLGTPTCVSVPVPVTARSRLSVLPSSLLPFSKLGTCQLGKLRR